MVTVYSLLAPLGTLLLGMFFVIEAVLDAATYSTALTANHSAQQQVVLAPLPSAVSPAWHRTDNTSPPDLPPAAKRNDHQERAKPIGSPPPLSLIDLPTGRYLYLEAGSDGSLTQGYILLRKAGRTVIGIDQRHQSQSPCFRGFLEGDRIVNAVRVFPPYDPASRLDQRRILADVSQYQRSDRLPTAEQEAALQTCIEFFWR